MSTDERAGLSEGEYWKGRAHSAWEQGDRLAYDLLVARTDRDAAVARAEAAEARHDVAHEHGMEIICTCGEHLSVYGLTMSPHAAFALHLRKVRAALRVGASE